MPPPPQLYGDVLDRTIRSLEQAQGHVRHRTTAAQILQPPTSDKPELALLSPTGMVEHASAVGVHATAASIPSLQVEANTPYNLISDLAASTTLLKSLRTRNSILVADLARALDSLQQHEGKAFKLLSGVCRSRTKWMAAAIFSLAIWMVYLWWCWYMRVEFEYIRKRRGEVFGL
jgi:hypothetical protein